MRDPSVSDSRDICGLSQQASKKIWRRRVDDSKRSVNGIAEKRETHAFPYVHLRPTMWTYLIAGQYVSLANYWATSHRVVQRAVIGVYRSDLKLTVEHNPRSVWGCKRRQLVDRARSPNWYRCIQGGHQRHRWSRLFRLVGSVWHLSVRKCDPSIDLESAGEAYGNERELGAARRKSQVSVAKDPNSRSSEGFGAVAVTVML